MDTNHMCNSMYFSVFNDISRYFKCCYTVVSISTMKCKAIVTWNVDENIILCSYCLLHNFNINNKCKIVWAYYLHVICFISLSCYTVCTTLLFLHSWPVIMQHQLIWCQFIYIHIPQKCFQWFAAPRYSKVKL